MVMSGIGLRNFDLRLVKSFASHNHQMPLQLLKPQHTDRKDEEIPAIHGWFSSFPENKYYQLIFFHIFMRASREVLGMEATYLFTFYNLY